MTAALIIASGKTENKERFTPEKQIGTITAVERVALLMQKAGIRRTVVVCEAGDQVKKLVPFLNLEFLEQPAQGDMLENIQAGLQYLQDKCKEVVVSYVDVPMFACSTVQALLDSPGAACVPSFQGKCGHPILLRQEIFSAIIAYRGEGGLKGGISDSGMPVQVVPVDDAGILSDIQQDKSWKQLVKTHDMCKFRPSVRLRISAEQVFYGPGVHQLLHLIQELGLLSEACRRMNISYGKGRKMIRTMEEQMGAPVLETRQGGKVGGYSRLTPEALRMMHAYDAFLTEAEYSLQTLFQKYFSE